MRVIVVTAVGLVSGAAHAETEKTPVALAEPNAAKPEATIDAGDTDDPPRKVDHKAAKPHEAATKSPIGVVFGIGAEFDRFNTIVATCGTVVGSTTCFGTRNTWGPSFVVDVGYRVMPELALGVHAAVPMHTKTRPDWEANNSFDPGARLYWRDVTYTPIRIGASAQLTVFDRLWLAPWLGFESGAAYEYREGQELAYGIGVGGDIVTLDRTRFGVRADATASPDHLYLGTGVAVRYW